jgi:hypothetical protein
MAEVPPTGLSLSFAPEDGKQPTFNFAMPPAKTQSDPESEDCPRWERLLAECFRDVQQDEEYSGNFVLDKMFAIAIAYREAQQTSDDAAWDFYNELKGIYLAKK